MRTSILLVLCISLVASVAAADSSEPRKLVPGGRLWRQTVAAVQDYCANEAAPSEALACRTVLRAFQKDDEPLALYPESDTLHLDPVVRDPRNLSYAWFLTFGRTGHGLTVIRFARKYDDCDCC